MATTWATGATDIRQREPLASGHRAGTPWEARGVTTWSFWSQMWLQPRANQVPI
jgi:hypothetical protein